MNIPLPIDAYLDSIASSLKQHRNLVLTAAPGAGKTTRLPAHLAALGLRVVMLEPRRLAARASAERIAFERGWKMGQEVGYQVRFENKTQPSTRLQILTEGVFTRRLQSNPELESFDVLILDEFHERSSNTDIALAFARELQELSRPDLHIIVMSATLNTASVAAFLGDAPVIDVPGLTFPVDIQLSREPQLLLSGGAFLSRAFEQVRSVVEGSLASRGDVLVFLPGVGEIEQLRSRLSSLATRLSLDILPLHGSLPLSDQDRVLRPSERRKIVLATNIAETSLTIPGVGTVIDTGLARVMRQEGENFPKLTLSRISRFSAIQRSGRAGRDGPGFAYRLWTKMDESSMAESEMPELLRTDAADVVLLLSAQGVHDPNSFTWFEKPPGSALVAAQILLRDVLDATDARGVITDMGRRLLEWPLPVRLARVMEESIALGCAQLGARIAALLSERDVYMSPDRLARWAQLDSDIAARLEIWDESLRMPQFATITRAYDQLVQMAERKSARGPAKKQSADQSELIAKLLLAGFSDRLAKRRGDTARALMKNGGGARVADASLVKRSPLIFCLEAITGRGDSVSARSEMMITRAAPLDDEILMAWLESRKQSARVRVITRTLVDRETKQVMTETFRAFDELPLEEPKRRGATAAEAASVLPDLVFESWERYLAQHPDAQQWLQRLEFLRRSTDSSSAQSASADAWPIIDEAFQRGIAEEVAMGAEKLEPVLKKDPVPYFEMRLTPQQRSLLAKEAPARLVVPSGNTVEVHYPLDRTPYIEARLQELFGWMQAPALASGRVALVVHVLGPNYRPVQVTADLRSFWSTSYQEVRKELRARYPKHDWPEDPFMAKPSSKGRRRQ